MTDKRTLILGIGNEILSDDGIGPRLVKNLAQMFNEPYLHFKTASCGGLEIMESIRSFDRAILVDAIRTRDGKPGNVYYFNPSDFRETSNLSNLHDINFLTALKLGDILRLDLPTDLNIIAVEIIEDLEFSEELTPVMNKMYPEILAKVYDLIIQITNN
ncbi:MAG: hydrogenase maturation protease [Bacteroidales bacterium]